MNDETIRQTLPCPACEQPLHLDVGLKIPSLPEAVMWQCGGCAQHLILTLMRDHGGPWQVRAFKIKLTERGLVPLEVPHG